MGSPERLLTATLNDGTEYTTGYLGWIEITGVSLNTIQKRSSARNVQLRNGKTPYTMRQVVGLDNLPNQRKKAEKVDLYQENKAVFDSFHRRRLVP